jgi:hypothetical protein
LEPEDIEKISLMIFDPESRIRKAVVSIFLSNVEATYEETLEGIGGNVEAVETELGDNKDTADGIPYTWLKYNALAKVLANYDLLVEEAEKEDTQGNDKIPYRGFEFGQVESRIGMAASAIIGEMDELQVCFSLGILISRTGTISLPIYCVITLLDPTKRAEMPRVFSQRHGKHVLSIPRKKSSSLKSSMPQSVVDATMKMKTTSKAKKEREYIPHYKN